MCFRDSYLRTYVRENGAAGPRAVCEWCGARTAYRLDLNELTDIFQKVAREFFVRFDDLAQAQYADVLDGERLGDLLDQEFEVLSDALSNRRNELVGEIVDAHYNPRDGGAPFDGESFWFDREWNVIEPLATEEVDRSLSATSIAVRCFGHAIDLRPGRPGYSADLLAAVQAIKQELRQHSKRLPQGSVLYRARIGQWQKTSDLAAPPPEKAWAGRGNIMGQPVLYLADSPETALAEVRPSVGDLVTVAKCILARPARLCTLISEPAGFSVFRDPARLYRVHVDGRRREALGRLFSKPITPSDTSKEYILSQFMAGIIRDLRFDGLLFRSAQRGRWPTPGFNYLLFDPTHAAPTELEEREVDRIEYGSSTPSVDHGLASGRWDWIDNVE
jgi:hypothetical protein